MMDPAEQARRLASRRKRLEYQAANERKTCNVPACSRPRFAMGQYCRAHHAVAAWSGDARAVQIRRRQTDRYEKQFTEFCERFPDHPAILAGEQWLEGFLADPRRYSRNQVVIDRIDGAYGRGARGPEMLTIIFGCYGLSHWEPRVLPEGPCLQFLVAKRLISTWRKGRKKTGSARDNAVKQGPLKRPTSTLRELGSIVHAHLGVLFHRVCARMDKDANELQALRTELWTPFVSKAEIAAAQQFNPHTQERRAAKGANPTLDPASEPDLYVPEEGTQL